MGVSSYQRAMIKSLIAQALGGELKAADSIIKLMVGIEQSNKTESNEETLATDEQEILDAYKEQIFAEKQTDKKGNENE